MDSFKDVLEAAQAYCKTQMAEPTYNLYIDGLEPISFEDSSHITLSVRNDFICKIVTDRYLGLLKEAFKTVLGFDVDITLVVPSTPPHEVVLAQQYEANPASPQGNYEFTFENFIKGPSNQFAFAAAQAVAANPSGAYNPLFIYGDSGLGKTHLMHSIGHFLLEKDSDTKVLYVTSEEFTNEVIESIRSGNAAAMTKLRDKYRTVDVLMVDDVQFIIGKESTQEEFFHTFNVLHAAGKQIVLSSDRPPKEMETLDERFRSRFEWGLIADIQPPDYETRMAILRKNAENCSMQIDEDIINYIATNIKSNIRELEGAFNKIIAFSKLNKVNPSLELAEEALKDIISPDKQKEITPELIINVVSEHFGVKPEDIISKKRTADLALTRQIVMYLCREYTDLSYQNIAKILNKKDHTTIIHGVNTIADGIKTDEDLNNKIDIIKKKLSPV